MTKILCPIDLQEASLNALNHAANFCRKTAGSLTIYHAITEAILVEKEELLPDEVLDKRAEGETMLNKICEETKKNFNIPCNYIIETIGLEDGIENITKKEKFNLIVMGTKGANKLSKFLTGSNTVHVINRIECPMLVIPSDYYNTDFQNMVYATNYQQGDDESITELLNIANMLGAKLTILHVSQSGNPAKLEIFKSYQDYVYEEFYYDLDVKLEQVVYDDVEQGILDYMEKHNCDMLAMLTQHRGLLGQVTHESLTRKMALLATYPILVFHK
ncbi:MAG: universal stress protein [Bacteroidota bacterium]